LCLLIMLGARKEKIYFSIRQLSNPSQNG